jgi:hypothetical protein
MREIARRLINGVWRTVDVDEINGNGGGGTPGAARVLGPFPFAFDTPGLAAGVEFYVPTPDDMLVNAWLRTLTAWTNHGSTTKADIGQFVGGETSGLFALTANGAQAQIAPVGIGGIDNIDSVGLGSQTANVFTTEDPLKIVVSVDGKAGSAASPATAGTSEIYLFISTPSMT